MARLLYQGHGSFRITTDKEVIYVDPYVGEGYDVPADIILVTHQHGDHNQIEKVTKKESCIIIQNQDALIDGEYQNFILNDEVQIQAVPAYNSNHDRNQTVGYIVNVSGIKIYATGDTSTTEEMKEYSAMKLDYILLPIDGVYNMDPREASTCAELVGAQHAIPIHMKAGVLFDAKMAEQFTAKNRLIVKAGVEIEL